VEICDGDLVQLARTGDGAAFRLLVERHYAPARARAARWCARPDEVDDVVQEAFLQAFVSLGHLRDPGRFGAWLTGIVLNVSRTAARRAPPLLLPDWPESLHPASAHGLPSAEDLDRAEVMRAAVAGLPAGQRQAVEQYYYADLPLGQIAGSAGAAKASLHRARRRLREYITVHRPDLIPAVSRRAAMIEVRIAHAEPQLDQPGDGRPAIGPVLVVLADDEGRRALPLRLNGMEGYALWRSAGHPPSEPSGVPGDIPPGQTATGGLVGVDLARRLLRAAEVPVTGVDIDELGPEVLAARIGVVSPAGTRQVTVRVGIGLALAASMGAPVRVGDALMNRLAVPVTGDDLPALLPTRQTAPGPGPRNMTFADGMDYWILGGSFRAGLTPAHWRDYAATTADGTATLRSAVADPSGDAFLGQVLTAGRYRGDAVTLCAEVHAEEVTGQAGLWLHVVTPDHGQSTAEHGQAITGSRDWTSCEITAQVPGDAQLIRFGLTLAGAGQVGLRNVHLTRAGPS
jgi:RNA polymerase sigma-70 factor (ECF subfamily)